MLNGQVCRYGKEHRGNIKMDKKILYGFGVNYQIYKIIELNRLNLRGYSLRRVREPHFNCEVRAFAALFSV